MTFLSISIDICGSTDAKAKLIAHAKQIGTEVSLQYEDFQRCVLSVESNFWTILHSKGLDIHRLFLIKTIGDELWYSYDLNNLREFEIHATIANMIAVLTSLPTKKSTLVTGPKSSPSNWQDEDPDDFIQLDLPIKITLDVISDALEMNKLREEYLKPRVAELLFPLGTPSKTVTEGDLVDLCNSLAVYSGVANNGKLFSLIRSDFIGWEIDRFFRLTKESVKGSVLIGPSVLALWDEHNLIEPNGTEHPSPDGKWMLSEPMLRVPHGGGYTSITNLVVARRTILAENLKGVGSDCAIAIAYWKYQDVKLD